MMDRRRFIVGGVAALAAPRAVGAQAAGKKFTIGMLMPDPGTGALVEELKGLGYIEGRNIVIERRSTGRVPERLQGLAAELVSLKPDVIYAVSCYHAHAVHSLTTTIPIVAIAGDFVGEGLSASLARPGGNVTGIQLQSYETVAKRVSFLKEAVPGLSQLGLAKLFSRACQRLGCGCDSSAGRDGRWSRGNRLNG